MSRAFDHHEDCLEPWKCIPGGCTFLVDDLRGQVKKLRSLVGHCWIHSGYPDCGYLQMTTEEKALYDQVKRLEPEESP